MKILLIQSRTDSPEGPVFPIGLAGIKAAMPEKHAVAGCDMNLYPDPYSKIASMISDFKPEIIGLSIRNIKVAKPGDHTSSVNEIVDMTARIRKLAPSIPLIAGGAGFSLYAKTIMEQVQTIDYGIAGEAELTLPMFLDNYPDIGGVPGVLWRDCDNNVYFDGLARRPDFKSLPWPDREMFPMEKYINYPTSVGVMTKRGCPFECIHCSDKYLLGSKMRNRPVDEVIAEIQKLKKDYGVYQFMFSDQEFNIPVDYTKKLLRKMISANVDMKWTAYFTPYGLDLEMVNLFRDSGCYLVNFSPDCYSGKMLSRLKKGYTKKALKDANNYIKKAEIPVTYNFMLGLPGENLFSLLSTLLFTLKTKMKLGKLFQLHGLFMVPARIYPHTELSTIALKNRHIEASNDLLTPEFSKPGSRITYLADKILVEIIFYLWKLKHREFNTPQQERSHI